MSVVVLLLVGLCTTTNLFCAGLCVWVFFFVCFAYILLSKFCLISPLLVRRCAWPRDSFFASSAALAVFSAFICNVVSLGACSLCLVCSFAVFFVYFSRRFCLRPFLVLLLCCLRRSCGCVFGSFVALVCFAVGFRYAGKFGACFVCVCVCVLCSFVCVCHVQILWVLQLLLRVRVCFVRAPIPVLSPAHLRTHSNVCILLPVLLGFGVCLSYLPHNMTALTP